MPYLQISTSIELSADKREAIKTAAGQLIEILPAKTEKGLMIRIDDGQQMYFRGSQASCAYVNVGLYLMSQDEKKGEFARAFTQALAEIAGLDPLDIYLNFSEYGNWFSNGTYK